MDQHSKQYLVKLIQEALQSTLTVYHGCNAKYADQISRTGLIASKSMGYESAGWYMVSTDFESALFHATPKEDTGDAIVFEFEIPLKKNDRWLGYPYLWKGHERSDNSTWFALMKPLPPKFIKNAHVVPYDQWLERKNLKF